MIFQLMEWFLIGAQMENNKAFTLTNGGKASFFLLSPLFLANKSQVQKEHK
jgi:hypothetical protein